MALTASLAVRLTHRRVLCLSRSFVWHKKLEKQLVEGADPRELTQKAERQRQAEREVRHSLFCLLL